MPYPELEQYSQIVSGKLFLRDYNTPASPMYEVGCWNEVNFVPSLTEQNIPNLRTPGGGKCETLERIDSLMLNFNMTNFRPDLLALLWYGTNTEETQGTGTAEEFTAFKNSLLPLPGLIDTVSAVTNVGATVTYVEDTDYYVESGGIVIPSTGDIAAADSGSGAQIEVSYTTKNAITIQTLVDKDREYYARFIGQNEARNNNEEVMDIWRLKFKMPTNIPVVDVEFKSVPMQAEILADKSRDYSGGLSQHLTIYRGIQT